MIAYNLENLWRRPVLPRRVGKWSLTSLQQRLVRTGGRLLKHARYYWLLLAGSGSLRRSQEAAMNNSVSSIKEHVPLIAAIEVGYIP